MEPIWKNSFFILVLFAVLHEKGSVTACFFRTSSPSISQTNSTDGNPLGLDKETISVVQQTLVKTLISLGKLKFHCPRENGTYPDMLDCGKYYNCTSGNYTIGLCESGHGFEPQAHSCIPGERVPLCQKVEKMKDYKCNNETGLRIYEGHCEKFILCTGDEGAFGSSCNHGDVFDQKLMLCLPEKEGNCTIPASNMPNGNGATTTAKPV